MAYVEPQHTSPDAAVAGLPGRQAATAAQRPEVLSAPPSPAPSSSPASSSASSTDMANDTDTSELGQAIQDVTERASLLIREEIELAKTEMTEKASKLGKGAGIGIVAGIFAVFGLIYLLHSASWIARRSATTTVARLPDRRRVLFIVGAIAASPRASSSAAHRRRPDGDRGGQADQGDGHHLASGAAPGTEELMAETRSAEEIRQSIEANRAKLGSPSNACAAKSRARPTGAASSSATARKS